MKIARKLLLGSSLVSLLVFAAEIPDALPAGFLEQLPLMMEMDADEYAAFLEFNRQDLVDSGNDETEGKRRVPEEINHEK
ncbi:MAG TPA: hypothetical protein ENJ87_05125 [Gammaproteobacteria bacterium]|nr:hypothetical protein [Gammaproteobacteria bacterium]